ncbi:MAG: FtsQ-type POTRA domain-containing protein, partial [Clostridia bacterium]|nr:FtsQ-type POTRA domain-containing protein [Clostridia bacterium]
MAGEYYSRNHSQDNADTVTDRAAERKQAYRRRRRIRRRIIASIIALLVLALILFVISLFIRVKEITITGTFGSYTYDQGLEACGIEEGDRILYIDTEAVENEIEKELPYMVNVDVKRRFSREIYIKIDYASEAYCLYTSDGFAVVNSDFKVLRIEQDEEQINLIRVIGLETEKAVEGEVLNLGENARVDYFKKLYNGLQGEPFGKLDYIDVTDSLSLSVGFKNGFVIKFGNYTNLDYNLGWAVSVVNELNTKHNEVDGTLDL